MQGMQACGINDMTDFLAKASGNPIKADFQCFNDRLLPGEELPLVQAFLSENVCGAHECLFLFCWNC